MKQVIHARGAHRRTVVLATLTLAVLVTPFVSVIFGAASVPPNDALRVVFGHLPGVGGEPTADRITEAIVWQTRMPRVMTGIGIGVILAVSGVALQAVVRNPLAEPYVLGVSSGASFGAALAIVVIGVTSSLWTAGLAFTGALLATVTVLLLGGLRGGSPLHLILAGLAVGFAFQSATNLVIFSARTAETAQAVLFWTLGSLTRTGWREVGLVLLTAAVMTLGLWIAGPVLDALSSGDATCLAVGINPVLARLAVLIPTSAAVGIAVAACGGIGFVGLVVPHLMRAVVGHSHRALVVGCALTGAVFLATTDAVARTAFSPVELPIGVITGLVGAPFLLTLVGRMRGTR